MIRQECFDAWRAHYKRHPEEVSSGKLQARAVALEREMRAIARARARMWRGFGVRELTRHLGMAVGVHRQLGVVLTSPFRGEYPERAAGGVVQDSARRATL